jgi:hypothetical protein
MKPVAIELHNELLSGRLLDPEYVGVVFAPVEEHGELIKIVKSTLNGTFNEQRKEFKTQEGARLQIADVVGDNPHYDYTGLQLSTVIISEDIRYDNDYNHKMDNFTEFVMYMNSRLRTKANMHTRLVLC